MLSREEVAVAMPAVYDYNTTYEQQFAEYKAWTQQNRQTSADWARQRREAIEAAPARRAHRLAKGGNCLPLVPANVGYANQQSVAKDTHFAEAGLRASHGFQAMRRAQGVYLQAQRFGDVRSLCRGGWRAS
jgi:hypothetical protein